MAGGRGDGNRQRDDADARRRAPADDGRRVAGAARAGDLGRAGNQALASLLRRGHPAAPETPAGEAGGPPVQRDVVSDVESKMSYGAFDWAVTDEEATDSLNMLASLPGPALSSALGRLSQTAKTRLLDNLPAAAKRTSAYTKLLVALGPGAVQPYVQSLLSYGVFDWAVTDDDADQVFRIMVALGPAQRTTLVQKLGPLFRGRLAGNLARASVMGDAEHDTLRALFDATPDTETSTLIAWIKARFRIDVGTQTHAGETGQAWDGASLRRLYNVLQSLPPGAVENNPELLRIDRYKDPGPAGGYYGSDRRVALGYGDIRARDSVADASNPGGAGMGVPAALAGQNLFDGVIRHEVGHSVDARLGLANAYCIGKPAGGNWQRHGDGSGLAAVIVAASGGAVAGLPAAQKSAVIAVLQDAIDDRTPDKVVVNLQALDFWGKLPAATKTAILADKAVVALQVSFADKTPGNPWYRPADDGGININGRIFVESYAHQWHSYDAAARARKASKYQFRAPGEWIAEAYNYYYAPPTKGALLAAVDPATKTWFDVNVDQASGGAGATAPGPALPAANTGPGYP
ncbi:MAG TPA: hypothetical protein VHN98_02125 [Acidimicrobiales bacterium]|nr:hypothetical protein [Acidimicrobiales bacterium]